MPHLTVELGSALEQWQKASLDITGRVIDDVDLIGACSVNYLMLCGTVLGGWLMAKSALVAMEKNDEDPDFYGAKIITAEFFAAHILPRAGAYATAATADSILTMGLKEEQF